MTSCVQVSLKNDSSSLEAIDAVVGCNTLLSLALTGKQAGRVSSSFKKCLKKKYIYIMKVNWCFLG